MSNLKEQIEKHAEDFTYTDSDSGLNVIGVGFVFAAYFWSGHKNDVRLEIAECFNDFNEMFENPFKWGFDNDAGKFKDIKKIPDINKYISTMNEDDTLSYYLSSAESHEAVGDYVIACITERGWMENYISVLTFNVPRTVVYDDSSFLKLNKLMKSFIERLNPYHANAGFSPVGTYEEMIWGGGKYDLATRYKTLYVSNFATDAIKAPFGIKSVNWLNYVSKKLALCIDDPENIPNYFSKYAFKAIELKDGFLIQATEFPQITHIAEAVPERYASLNALLRPIRMGMFGSMGSMSINGESRFNECTTDLWIRRLDADNVWPPGFDVVHPSRLSLIKPKSSKYLKSASKCEIHGRYRNSNMPWPDGEDGYDPAHYVVLLPNDIAPYQLKLGAHGVFVDRVSVKWELVHIL